MPTSSVATQDLNGLIASLPAATCRDALAELAQTDPMFWVMYKRRLRGQAYTFNVEKKIREFKGTKHDLQRLLLRHRPFLIEPLRDPHPHKVYMKGRQVGVSELSIDEVLWFLDTHPKTKWVYTFPRDKQLTDFSVTRISEAFNETERMKRIVGTPNQVQTKQIGPGGSYLLLRSAWESNLGEGIDADGVTFDEKDRMKEGIEFAFRESLKSSAHGWLREVSTPTLPGKGVDISWQKSDQREWFVRCTKCHMMQAIDYPANVVQMKDIPLGTKELPEGTYEYRCKKESCRGRLDRLNGTWIAKFPERNLVRGYAIPQTIAPWITATRLMQNKIDYKFHQLWVNYCLGRTATGESMLLTENDFHQCIADPGYSMLSRRTDDWERIVVGIDWGHLNWVVVLGINTYNQRTYLLNIGVFEDDVHRELDSVKHIESFIAPFEPDLIVADGGYGKDRNTYLLRKYPNKLFACWYNPSDKSSRTFTPSWQEGSSKVLIDRTITLKNMCRAIKEAEVGLPLPDPKLGLLVKHCLNLAPLLVEEDGEVYETIAASGDDHLAHALGYALVAEDKFKRGFSNFSCTFD